MTIYAVGDVQGCHDALMRLLDRVGFDPADDELWSVGDLVSRGPDSLASLRTIHGLGASACCVLGNHDLHLLGLYAGSNGQRGIEEDLRRVLDAPDCDQLMDWLRRQPLVRDVEPYLLVHAGLPADWTPATAVALAGEVEERLRSWEWTDFVTRMYGNRPDRWDPSLHGIGRLRFIVNACTRMRYVDADGRLDFEHKGPPDSQRGHLLPWYQAADPAWRGRHILFGHWSSLGFMRSQRATCLDSGCVWGRELTALQINDGGAVAVSVSCRDRR